MSEKFTQHFSVFKVKMTQHFSVFEVKMTLTVYGSGLELSPYSDKSYLFTAEYNLNE